MRGRSAGYTLIELVVVVAMLGMLIGLAAPRMAEQLFTNDVEATAKWLEIATTRLREKAQQTQITHILRVDVSGRQFFLESENPAPVDPETAPTAALKLANGLLLNQVLLGKTVIPVDNQAQIRFFPDGSADLATIHMTANTGHRFTWIIEPFMPLVVKMEGHGQYADYWQ